MKVCLIGSAPSSVNLAPYEDPEWQIWGCSPGAFPQVRRWDAYFEIHLWEKAPWFSAEYINFLASGSGSGKPVYMIRPVPEIPNSVAYPKEEMVARFGPYFFNSSLSWMFALAIARGATEIAMYGVDMSANEEWVYQRSGCQHFIQLAKSLGIKVHIPPQSDLLRPPPLYGFCEEDPLWIKMAARKAELDARIQDALRREGGAREERLFYQGAMDDILYIMKTWIADPQAISMAYSQPQWMDEPLKVIPSLSEVKPNGSAVPSELIAPELQHPDMMETNVGA